MLILDFDGTLTDVEREGIPFTAGYLRDLAEKTKTSFEEIRHLHDHFQAQILATPQDYNWMMNGLAVAPAGVDPYLRIKPIATMILKHCGVHMDPMELQQWLTGPLYKKNYDLTLAHTHFRPGAKEFMTVLWQRRTKVAIVTNSGAEAVIGKIRSLGMEIADECDPQTGGEFFAWWRRRVHGSAKKYVAAAQMREGRNFEFRIPGLDRPIYCARPHYLGLLSALIDKEKTSIEQTLVVGDIFELDGALPLKLGCRVGLMRNDMTPEYEVRYLKAHPMGHVLESVDQILPLWEYMPRS